MSSFMQAAFDSLFQPGLNTPMRTAMDLSFYGLFVVLFGLIFVTGGNVHVIALLCIALGLFFSIHWFLAELARLPPSATQVQQMPPAEPSAASEATVVSESKKAI